MAESLRETNASVLNRRYCDDPRLQVSNVIVERKTNLASECREHIAAARQWSFGRASASIGNCAPDTFLLEPAKTARRAVLLGNIWECLNFRRRR
jgi:hypothetical protein